MRRQRPVDELARHPEVAGGVEGGVEAVRAESIDKDGQLEQHVPERAVFVHGAARGLLDQLLSIGAAERRRERRRDALAHHQPAGQVHVAAHLLRIDHEPGEELAGDRRPRAGQGQQLR